MILTEMNGRASAENVLALTLDALRDVKVRIRPVFGYERIAVSAGRSLETLLGNEPRKTAWMQAEAAGDPGPWPAGTPGAGSMGC